MGRKSRLKAQRREVSGAKHITLYDKLGVRLPHVMEGRIHFRSDLHHRDYCDIGSKLYPAQVDNFRLPFPRCFFEFKNAFSDMKYLYSNLGIVCDEFEEGGLNYIVCRAFVVQNERLITYEQGMGFVATSGELKTRNFPLDAEQLLKEKIAIAQYNDPTQLDRILTECIAMPLISTIHMLNIRNVELIDNVPDPRLSAIHEREYGRPLSTYKTLSIKSTRKEYQNSAEGEEHDPVKRRLHIVRGHPRHVAGHPTIPDGTYWVRPHVRGDESLGVVVKDYKVKA